MSVFIGLKVYYFLSREKFGNNIACHKGLKDRKGGPIFCDFAVYNTPIDLFFSFKSS